MKFYSIWQDVKNHIFICRGWGVQQRGRADAGEENCYSIVSTDDILRFIIWLNRNKHGAVCLCVRVCVSVPPANWQSSKQQTHNNQETWNNSFVWCHTLTQGIAAGIAILDAAIAVKHLACRTQTTPTTIKIANSEKYEQNISKMFHCVVVRLICLFARWAHIPLDTCVRLYTVRSVQVRTLLVRCVRRISTEAYCG